MPLSPKPREPRLTVHSRLASIARHAWEACANPPGQPFYPFASYDFLDALEKSGSATPETGWMPQHLVVEDEKGSAAGAMPLYAKGHSYGEYVFDHSWADAYERAGGRYYPKLLCAIPFTPATGPRLLLREGAADTRTQSTLIAGALALLKRHALSSLHINFLARESWLKLSAEGFLLREHEQFHWRNDGYGSFEDFLGTLASRKRKQIRKERREALANGICVRWLTGRDLTESYWDAFFKFYTDTGSRKWGTPYLTRAFFSLVGATMAEHILLVICERAGRPIAGALNFIGGDTLYGRYWGAIEDHPCLHFEACYYQAIEFAIARGLKLVEAGAQGLHKLARGYAPTLTYSAHFIADPRFRAAVARFLEDERREVEHHIAALSKHTPFRHDGSREEDS